MKERPVTQPSAGTAPGLSPEMSAQTLSPSQRRRGFWARFFGSWWLLPVLHFLLFWGGCTTAVPLAGAMRKSGLVSDCLDSTVFGICWILGMATAACCPVVVLVQLIRRQWKTALATALFSAIVLTPFVWLLLKLSELRNLC